MHFLISQGFFATLLLLLSANQQSLHAAANAELHEGNAGAGGGEENQGAATSGQIAT